MPSKVPTRSFTIKKKLALLFIGFALIPSSIVGAVSYWYSKSLSGKYALNVESLAVETLNRVNSLFPYVQNTLLALSNKSELSDVSTGIAGMEIVSISQVLTEAAKINQGFSLLLVTDPNRNIKASNAPGSMLIGKQAEDSPEYNEALRGKTSRGRCTVTQLTGHPVYGFWVHVPIYSAWEKSTPIGILSGLYSLDPITSLIRQVKIEGKVQDTSRYIELMRNDGLLLSAPLFIEKAHAPLELNVLQEFPALAAVTAVRENSAPRGTINQLDDSWGDKVVGFAGSSDSGLAVLVFVDRSVVFRQINTLRNFLAIFTILVMTVSALSAWPISKLITTPISIAVDVARQVAACDLTAQVEVTSGDETGQLLDAVGQMTSNLNSLVRRVKQSSIQLVSTTTEITAAARQQEAAVNDFGASTGEIAVAVKEILATSQGLVATMGEISGVAESTASLADSGRTGLTDMQTTMRQLTRASAAISSKLSAINDKTRNINIIITAIAKVADQTNLLSLNAGIEAEKAGEYGLGFAVVAREIRRLADQTATATLDVEEMVKEMQSAVSSGVMEMDKFTEAVRRGVEETTQISGQLARIIGGVEELTPRFAAVNEGMQSQSQGAQQIGHAVFQLNDAAQQTSISLREFNLATEALNEAVRDLRDEISRFKVRSQ
jgi:methyl-accepting chemotaxis protein